MSGYKILRFVAENVNGLKAVEITPTGDIVQLQGKNGAGKSSVIDSIMQTLRGGLELREGTENGESILELGSDADNYRIRRIVSEKGTRIEITTGKDWNLSVNRPSDFLRGLVGPEICIDPTMFVNQKSGKIRKQLLLDALDIDTTEIDEKIADVMYRRKGYNLNIESARVKLRETPIDTELPADLANIQPLIDNLTGLKDQQREIHQGVEQISRTLAEINDDQAELADLETEIKAEEERIANMKKQFVLRARQIAESLKKVNVESAEWDKKVEEFDEGRIDKAQESIDTFQQTNLNITANNTLKLVKVEMENDQVIYRDLGREMKSLEKERQAQIDMPIDGIEIGEDDVVWNGVSAEHWSTGEAMLVGCAVRIAQGGDLKVVFVDNVSLLDVEMLEKMRSLFAGDFQIWEVHNQVVGKPINLIKIVDGTIAAESEE